MMMECELNWIKKDEGMSQYPRWAKLYDMSVGKRIRARCSGIIIKKLSNPRT